MQITCKAEIAKTRVCPFRLAPRTDNCHCLCVATKCMAWIIAPQEDAKTRTLCTDYGYCAITQSNPKPTIMYEEYRR